ncbi:protein FAR1-RELATED SEQUENCE 5-like [Rosa rugosa]|nr:protein FAR1-RELATED SEQUENCE 5-like [Rosa rugosa]
MDGSYESSMCNGSNCNEMQYKGVRYDKLSTEDLKGQEFKTVEEAESFYNAYAKAMGFGVRNDYKRLSIRITGRVTSLRLVCSAQGKRREEYMSNKKRVRRPKKETRFSCPCLFKVRYRSNINAYIVDDFITNHSHQLAQAHESHLLRSHRSVEDQHLALATSMQRVSVKPCHTYEYIVDRSGGFKNVGFIMKDLYNKLDSRRREILLEGDAEAALAYMRGKVATDSHFYCKFSIDEDNRLANMFWRDSNSLVDYTCFGDVLVFDSTYKTNPYEKPLVLFVGSNNHLSTTVFGFALLMDETIETYTWVLETFISSMNNKRPVAVLTDGDEAMRRAIEVVLPGCAHRLCTWHIAKNARRHLRKNSVFSEFRRCMWDEVTPDGFEKRWNAMVNTHGLHNKDWVKMMYEKRQIWAEAFISGHFFARMRSTQRCEGMNSYMKGYLKNGVKLFELIPALDRALLRLRNKVVEEDFKSNNSSHVLTSSLRKLEHHAGTMFTDSVFEHVRNEIDGVGDLITSRTMVFGSSRVYFTSSYNNNKQEIEYTTVYYPDENNPRMECSCKLFE